MKALALLATGVWLGLIVASWLIASISFRTSGALLGPEARPELVARLGAVKEDDRRPVLRHVASEINRAMFGRWLALQLALGAALLFFAYRAGGLWPAVAAMAVVLVQAALQGPILEIGRSVDFLPRPLPPDIGARFGRLHAAYVLLDVVKMAALAVAAWLVSRGPR